MKNEIKENAKAAQKFQKREDFVKITLLDNKLYVNPSKNFRQKYVCLCR